MAKWKLWKLEPQDWGPSQALGMFVMFGVIPMLLAWLIVQQPTENSRGPEQSSVASDFAVGMDEQSIDYVYYLESSVGGGLEDLLVEIAGGQDAYDEVLGPESPFYNPNGQAAFRSMIESMESGWAVELEAMREELGLDVLRSDTPTPSEEPKGDGMYVVGDEISTGTWILDGFAQGADDARGSTGYVDVTGCEWSLIDSDGNTLHTYSRSRAHIPNYAHTFASTDCGIWVLQMIGSTAQTSTVP